MSHYQYDDAILNWQKVTTHALPVVVHWQTDFTRYAFIWYRYEILYRSEILAPVQQPGWIHIGVTHAGITFCGGIM